MTKLDQFLAKRIFGPPIIRYCQWTGTSQYRAAKELSFIGWVIALWQSQNAPWWVIAIGVFCGVMELAALAIWPDKRSAEPGFYRPLLFALIVMELAFVVIGAGSFGVFLIFWLAASYANDIDTIPPREKKNLTKAKMALG